MKVAFGGTFDKIHKGHTTIFERAFSMGDEVLIGVTSDEMANRFRGYSVAPVERRMKKLEEFLSAAGYEGFEIVEIADVHGPAPQMQALDAIIASEETKGRAEEINRMREENNLTPLEIHLVPLVLADDSCPVSSTRIRNGEIDVEGKMLRPLVVNVGSKNKAKIWAARDIFLKVFKKVEIHGIEVKTEVPDSPLDDETRHGAINRAKESIEGADFGVGIEGGMETDTEDGSVNMLHCCAIVDKRGIITVGQGPVFRLPRSVVENVRDGLPLIEAERRILNVEQIEEEKGLAGHLSMGITSRRKLAEISVLMALIPRLRPDLYTELWKQNP